MISAKLMLLGDIGVGKSSLARRLVFDRFESGYKTTLGVDVFAHELALASDGDHARMRLVLWDTDGDLGHRIFETAYPAGASAAAIVADASRPATVTTMSNLARRFEARFPGRPVMRIINKIDLAPKPEELLAADPTLFGAVFASARTGAGVGEVFYALAEQIARRAS